jgi:hypothetical protein
MDRLRFHTASILCCALALVPTNALATEDLWSDQFAPPPGGQGITAGMYTRVFVQMEFQGDLIVGGEFAQAGNVSARGIARWDGQSWHPLGSGLNGNGYALAVYDGDLIVGGYFTEAGGIPASRIARWDGSTWSSLGQGIGTPGLGAVTTLAVYDGDLIAGGVFTQAGGTPADQIARWDGTSWSELGGGIRGDNAERVMTLLAHEDDLIVGGHFSEAGNQPISGIARWDGSAWSPMDGEALGQGPFVEKLLEFGGQLYAGGAFYPVGVGLDGVVRWDGTTWQMLGDGLGGGGVQSLTVYRGQLVAGGYFSTSGPDQVRFVGRWDGSDWQPLGTGVDGVVYSVAAKDNDLYVGGWFDQAGGLPSSRIACWTESAAAVSEPEAAPPAIQLAQNLPNPFHGSTRIAYALTQPGRVRLSIYDLAGRHVATLVDELRNAGGHEAVWDGHDAIGRRAAAGMYVYRLQSGTERSARRMLRLD